MGEQPNGDANPDEVFRVTPDRRGGVACLTGARVGVSQLLGYLRDGHTIEDFLSDFPTVTRDQVQFAIERIDNEYMRMRTLRRKQFDTEWGYGPGKQWNRMYGRMLIQNSVRAPGTSSGGRPRNFARRCAGCRPRWCSRATTSWCTRALRQRRSRR